VAAATGAVLIAAAAPAATHWSGSAGVGQAAALDQSAGTALAPHATPSAGGYRAHSRGASTAQRPSVSAASSSQGPAATPAPQAASPRLRHHHRHHKRAAASTVYDNPLRAVSGLIPERIDQGVDFGGSGPIYALGDAVITNASGDNYGWPDGGWITYRLTDGPGAGLTVFVAEDVRPTVAVGQKVTSSTVIADMFDGGAGIETGWAMASGLTAESQLPEAGSISGAGPFPTEVGLNFEELLQALGVPAANNRYDTPYGILPASYPADWPAALGASR
jgi:hypothetical protein